MTLSNGVRALLVERSLTMELPMSLKQDLLEELDAFDPRWRDKYSTLEAAAHNAGPHARALCQQFLDTPEGKALASSKQTVVDWNQVNEQNRALAQASLRMARDSGDF